MRKSALLLSVFALIAGIFGISTSAASADVPGLEIAAVGYNAYGADGLWNRNAEYVDIKNASAAAVNVKGLIVEDAWRHAQPADTTSKCNRYVVSTIPGAADRAGEELQAGHTLRVYVGAGEPKVLWGGTVHAVYMDSPQGCGYNGHIFNNGKKAGASPRDPWDTVYITLGGVSETKSYNFSFGYWVS